MRDCKFFTDHNGQPLRFWHLLWCHAIASPHMVFVAKVDCTLTYLGVHGPNYQKACVYILCISNISYLQLISSKLDFLAQRLELINIGLHTLLLPRMCVRMGFAQQHKSQGQGSTDRSVANAQNKLVFWGNGKGWIMDDHGKSVPPT